MGLDRWLRKIPGPQAEYVRRTLDLEGGLKRLVRNAVGDLRYGGRFLGGYVANPGASLGHEATEHAGYGVLGLLFGGLEIRSDDVIVDVGCGRARMMNWFLGRGLRNRMVGLEINAEVARETARRLRRYPQISIIEGDAIANLPGDGTIFYLYNPFSRELMEKFAERVGKLPCSGAGAGARPMVVYLNALHMEPWERSGEWELRRGSVMPYSRHEVAVMLRR